VASERWLEAGQPLTSLELERPKLKYYQPLFERHTELDHNAMKTDLLTRHRYVMVLELGMACSYEVAN
jgi:hypothetical protein